MLSRISVELDFLNLLSSPVFIKNTNGVYIYCNQGFENFLGLSSEKIINKTSLEVSSTFFAPIEGTSDTEVLQTTKLHHYVSAIKLADKLVSVQIIKAPLLSESSQLLGLMGTINILSAPSRTDLNAILTTREKDVLKLLMIGISVKKMAHTLGISPYTVNDHLKSIYRKLGVHSKVEALYKMVG